MTRLFFLIHVPAVLMLMLMGCAVWLLFATPDMPDIQLQGTAYADGGAE